MVTDFLLSMTNDYFEAVKSYSPQIFTAIVILIMGFLINKILVAIFKSFIKKIRMDSSLKSFIDNTFGVFLWIILITFILAVLGVNIAALLAGLGIAGFIIGFALKDTLGNLASGVFILFHRPFRVDDWIKVGGVGGTVDKIGIAACTLTSPDGVKITIPNSKVWGDTIQNYTGNKIRKIYNLNVGISYSDDIGKAIKIINNILKKDKRILKDPEPQVVPKEFGDNAVIIAVRPSVEKDDYWDVYFSLVKEIKESFDKNNITIPFPQRDVWIKEGKKRKTKKRKG